MTLLQSGLAKSSAADYTIANSLRFNAASNSYMDSAGGVGTGSRTTWTLSFWVKKTDLGDDPVIVAGYRSGSSLDSFVMGASGSHFYVYIGGYNGQLKPNGAQRDPAAWYHWVCAWDTTAVEAERMRLYMNGERVSLATEDLPSENEVSNIGLSGTVMNIGQQGDTTQFGDMYLADVIFTDGTAYDASDFGEINSETNQWVPTDPSTLTFGTNGFWFKFENASALGEDYSGNDNDYAANGLYGSDQGTDTPTNNFATFNSIVGYLSSGTTMAYQDLDEGALHSVGNSASNAAFVEGTISFSTGKWYTEFLAVGLSTYYPVIGIMNSLEPGRATGYSAYSWAYDATGRSFHDSGNASYGDALSAGDIVGIAVDATNGAIYVSVNNVWQASSVPTSGASKTNALGTWTGESVDFVHSIDVYTTDSKVIANWGFDSSFLGQKTGQNNPDGEGFGDFYYTPPSGFLALCTSNLSDPSIALPGGHFNTTIYTGNGGTQAITGLGFQPDNVWIKNRDTARNHANWDAVRGVEKQLQVSTTGSETTEANGLKSYDSDGFTLGLNTDINENTDGMVAWSWLGDGVDGGTLNEVGSLDSQVNANTAAGFSICTYDGNETGGATFGHGLSEAPTLVIVKKVVDSGSHWVTGFNAGTTHNGFKRKLDLDRNIAQVGYDDAGYFNSTNPSATVVTLGNYGDTNKGTGMLAWCFHSVEGYSKIGSWSGNGQADGPFQYCGFRPVWILSKDAQSTEQWQIRDAVRSPYNAVDRSLAANLDSIEAQSGNYDIDFLSNGFKIKTSDPSNNTDGNDYLYIAVAEFPFKYSLGR